jgi:hypothetical protein
MPAATDSTSAAAETAAIHDEAVPQLAEVKVSLLLPLITPLEYEKRFWTSHLYEAAAQDWDTVHLFMQLVSEGLYLFRFQAGVPSDVVRPFRVLTSRAFWLVLVHCVCKVVSPAAYWSCRRITQPHLR